MTNDEAIKRQIKQNERKLWIMERDFRAAIVELMEANPEFDLSCATDLACSTNHLGREDRPLDDMEPEMP
jgi:hypothetical protein